jgi:hypothetical protein
MPALKYDLVIEQGSTFRRTIPVLNDAGVPIDLTDWTARGQIRRTYGSEVAYDLVPCLTVADTDVELVIPAADSSEWAWRSGVYDIEIVDVDGAPTRLLQGTVTVSPEVTR